MDIYYDEAGRWPLAWPVAIWLVYIKRYTRSVKKLLKEAKDSKLLTEKRRTDLYERIISEPWIQSVVTFSHAKTIDKFWIITAIHKAICQWLRKLCTKRYLVDEQKTYSLKRVRYLVAKAEVACHFDGNHTFDIDTKLKIEVETIIKWDQKIPEISCASIVAKVVRDRYMITQAKKYPLYGFEDHKWYGTLAHRKAIKKYWCSKLHRVTFCETVLQNKKKTTSKKTIETKKAKKIAIPKETINKKNIKKPKEKKILETKADKTKAVKTKVTKTKVDKKTALPKKKPTSTKEMKITKETKNTKEKNKKKKL